MPRKITVRRATICRDLSAVQTEHPALMQVPCSFTSSTAFMILRARSMSRFIPCAAVAVHVAQSHRPYTSWAVDLVRSLVHDDVVQLVKVGSQFHHQSPSMLSQLLSS